MKNEVLRLLKQSSGYLSGEEISSLLGVSRTAVWKHIKTLKAEGYKIDSQTKTGYRLIQVPDCLYPAEVREFLSTRILGGEIFYLPSVSSTNREAREKAENGAQDGAVVLAESQTAGRGRLGREWYSPAQTGLWMSVILRPKIVPADAPKLTLITATAVAEAIIMETGLNPGIKWPNDILLNRKKVCGILTEMKADMDRVHYVVVGMGLNISQEIFPEDIREIATSLTLEAEKKFNRAKIAGAVLNSLEKYYFKWINDGFSAIRNEWKRHSVNLGQKVTVNTLGEVVEGIAEDIDENGLLVVRKIGGSIKKITAGDVTLR
ncbi:MAG: biotin--[acetyl-CoA-carboxylase] ligase [Bacillota bacterium]|jgi:BirA family biotin operon repressor/biotin-[acetyl-CoA-carboxylase] ligase